MRRPILGREHTHPARDPQLVTRALCDRVRLRTEPRRGCFDRILRRFTKKHRQRALPFRLPLGRRSIPAARKPAEIRPHHRIMLRERRLPLHPRQLQKRRRGRWSHMPRFASTIAAVAGHIVGEHFFRPKDIAKTAIVVDHLRAHRAASLEQAHHIRVMIAIERQDRGEHVVPSLGPTRDEMICVEVLTQTTGQRLFGRPRIVIERLQLGDQLVLRHHQYLRVECKCHQVFGKGRELLGHEGIARFEHHVEPDRKTIGIEMSVFSRAIASPQIVVENSGQLLRARKRDQLAGIFQPDALDQTEKRGGLECIDLHGQIGRLQYASEERLRRRATDGVQHFGHRDLLGSETWATDSKRCLSPPW